MKDGVKQIYMAACIGPNGERIGAYKFGCSHGWADRVKHVTVNLPFTLEVEAVAPGGYFMEHACHLYLREYRIAGEYFRDCEEVRSFIAQANRRGHAFDLIRDNGDEVAFIPSFKGFLAYHKVLVDDACRRGGLTKSYYTNKAGEVTKPSRKLLAAAALVAIERGQFVRWPEDGRNGSLGRRSGGKWEASQQVAA